MYTDEEIYRMFAEAMRAIGPTRGICAFWKKYHARNPYPSRTLINKRFGGVAKLILKVGDWERKQHGRSMPQGQYINDGGHIISILPVGDDLEVKVRVEGKEYKWRIPKSQND